MLRNQNLGSWHTWAVAEPKCKTLEEKFHRMRGTLGEAAGEGVREKGTRVATNQMEATNNGMCVLFLHQLSPMSSALPQLACRALWPPEGTKNFPQE